MAVRRDLGGQERDQGLNWQQGPELEAVAGVAKVATELLNCSPATRLSETFHTSDRHLDSDSRDSSVTQTFTAYVLT